MMRIMLIGSLLAAAGGGGGWWYLKKRPAPPPAGAHAFAKKGTFTIAITEQGTFTAKDSMRLQVEPEVFNGQLTITMVVPAGQAVKKDDVVMEFDVKEIERQLSQAEMELQAGQNDVVQTQSDLKIQLIENKINIEKARYDFEAAKMTLKKWKEIEEPKAVKELEAKISESENAAAESKRSLEVLKQMKEEDLVAEAEVKKAELALSKSETDLEFSRLALKLMKEYDNPLQTTRLENGLKDTQSLLEGRESGLKAVLAQKESAVLRAESALKEKTSHVEKLKADMEKMKLKAPVDGIVLYGDPEQFWREMKIQVGEKIWAHNTLLTIPDLSSFKVKMSVMEADINKVKEGMIAVIRPEAIPDLVMKAKVEKVSTVTSNSRPWDENSKSKFDIELSLEGVDERIKPGMKCKVEIVTDEVKDVIHVPVDAVFEKDGKSICWIVAAERPEERVVKTGKTSQDYVELVEGLKEGEKVALYDPMKEK